MGWYFRFLSHGSTDTCLPWPIWPYVSWLWPWQQSESWCLPRYNLLRVIRFIGRYSCVQGAAAHWASQGKATQPLRKNKPNFYHFFPRNIIIKSRKKSNFIHFFWETSVYKKGKQFTTIFRALARSIIIFNFKTSHPPERSPVSGPGRLSFSPLDPVLLLLKGVKKVMQHFYKQRFPAWYTDRVDEQVY